MAISISKSNTLRKEGYKYHFDRGLYYNRDTKKIFSEEAVDDNPEEWLRSNIKAETNNKWTPYFNDNPTESQLKEILKDIQ